MNLHRVGSLSLALILALASPGWSQTVGFSRISVETEWRARFSDSITSVAEERGIELLLSDARSDPKNQIAAVRDFIEKRVDAIIVVPVIVTGLDDVLRQANAAKIPVFVVDRAIDTDPDLYAVRIAANFNLEGKLAGAWLAQASRGRCNIIELQGTARSSSAIERKRGFEAAIAPFPAMRIVVSERGDFKREAGKLAMQKALASPAVAQGICAVFAHNDDMMLGAIEAMKEAGLQPGADPLTVSIDGMSAGRAAIAAGDLNATVEHASEIGGAVFDIIQEYLGGDRTFPKWVVVPSDLYATDGCPKK